MRSPRIARGSWCSIRHYQNDEARPRAILDTLVARRTVLVVVDQPATVGALPVGYLPGPTMRRMADTLPGEAKTDAREALVIATTARTSPHRLRSSPGAPRSFPGSSIRGEYASRRGNKAPTVADLL